MAIPGNVIAIKTITFGTGKTWAAVSAVQCREQTVTVPGLRVGDVVVQIDKPTKQNDLAVAGGRVSAADTLSVDFINPSAGAITPTAAEEYKLTFLRHELSPVNHANT